MNALNDRFKSDWDYCFRHDCPKATCENLPHGIQLHWTEVLLLAILLAFLLDLLFSMRTP